ncbi:MAG: phosphatase PAP2 family protein [Saprospiraceae bacterium]|nr:phosphatase PAP2 family protein [Lewinellaceae bacterium]
MKNSFWAVPWFSIPVLLFFILGLFFQLFVPTGHEILYLNPWRTAPLNFFFKYWTQMGEAPVFIAIGLLSMAWRYRFALLIALTGLVVIPTSYFMKESVRKDRPITFFEKIGMRDAVNADSTVYLNRGKTSFPSGHSMAAFAMYGLMAFFSDKKRNWFALACAITAILVAFSRIFLVQHFLADILGGAFIGLVIAHLIWWFNKKYLGRLVALDKGLIQRFKQA